VVAFAGTVTTAGTWTEVLLLETFTLRPPPGAELVIVKVQTSVPEPVMDALLQMMALNCTAVWASASPVPLRLIAAELLVEELLVTVN
jgi:hypothetical protein